MSDQAHARLQGASPGLGDLEALEQLPAAPAEEVRDGAGMPMRDQSGVDAVFERGPLAHEVQPEASALALCADGGIGQPERGHEIAAGELGQDPGVDLVGLTGKRRQSLHPLGIGDLDLEAGQLELIVDEASAVHRFDHRQRLTIVAAEAVDEPGEAILVGGTAPRSTSSPPSLSA